MNQMMSLSAANHCIHMRTIIFHCFSLPVSFHISGSIIFIFIFRDYVPKLDIHVCEIDFPENATCLVFFFFGILLLCFSCIAILF